MLVLGCVTSLPSNKERKSGLLTDDPRIIEEQHVVKTPLLRVRKGTDMETHHFSHLRHTWAPSPRQALHPSRISCRKSVVMSRDGYRRQITEECECKLGGRELLSPNKAVVHIIGRLCRGIEGKE